MTLRSDGTMYCKGCDRLRPRSLFWKNIRGEAHHVLCEDCRGVRKSPAVIVEPEPPHRVAFIVGYGPQLFPPHVKMTGLGTVDRATGFWAGEMYNANMR